MNKLSEGELSVCNATGVLPGDFARIKRDESDGSKDDATFGLSAVELDMCKRMGLTPKAFAAAKTSDHESARLNSVFGLTAEELTVCRITGVSPAAFASCDSARTPHKVDAAQPFAVAAVAFALPEQPGTTIDIQFTPSGDFRPADGRSMSVAAWRIDATIAARVIQRAAERVTPAVVDYEHQTLRKEENGQPAPAAGWIRSLHWREGKGLYGRVELTQRAREFIAANEYRFFSPVFKFDRQTGEVESIEMGALTNHPALDGMEPISLSAAATRRLLTRHLEER